ncbi:DUF1993 domain-containing protein [Erythrobacter sp. THAF29]|uniref:DUF1993 family protein n=1 Tax=Erythrobacter sp. THAF29 TaxID=2587851 RepID=UPI00126973AB|nr:DUF1993 domain-containing protein [Erythrobacter sp. THAF29]QFT78537.1 hypothetical protein FIU90_13390 [Erythrobacter sp. THAF29]
MPMSLHDAFVPSARQILIGMKGLVDKAEAFVRDNGLQDSELIDAKLAEDMWSLPWHVRACWVHTGYAVRLVMDGEFTPDFTEIPSDWEAMRTMLDDALAELDGIDAEALEAISGQTTGFILGGKRLMEMTAANFLLSFNQPNFNFHAATFYGILRMKSMPLGKMDFMGPMRVLGS